MNIEQLLKQYEENPYDITTVSLLYHELKERNDERADEFKTWLNKLTQGKRIVNELDEIHYLDDEVSSDESLKTQVLKLQKKELVYKQNKRGYSECKRSTFIILAVLFGSLGIHNFYIKNYGTGFLQLFFYGLLALTGFGLFLVYFLLGLEILYTTTDGNGKPLT